MDVFLRQIEQANKVPNTKPEPEIIQAKLDQLDAGLILSDRLTDFLRFLFFFQKNSSKIPNLRRAKI